MNSTIIDIKMPTKNQIKLLFKVYLNSNLIASVITELLKVR